MESSITLIVIWIIGVAAILFILYLLGANQSKLISARDKQLKILNQIKNSKK